VTVLSHPSLTGINSGTGISGSTAWHGAFRFRQYLKGVKSEAGEQPDGDLRQLEFKKNQYGPIGESIVLRYQRGLFLPERGLSTLEKAAHDQEVENLFETLLKQFEENGRNVSASERANNYAPRAFANEKAAKDKKLRKADFESAMLRLFERRAIHAEEYGRGASKYSRIKLGSGNG
jgi:RecA-family ATPase